MAKELFVLLLCLGLGQMQQWNQAYPWQNQNSGSSNGQSGSWSPIPNKPIIEPYPIQPLGPAPAPPSGSWGPPTPAPNSGSWVPAPTPPSSGPWAPAPAPPSSGSWAPAPAPPSSGSWAPAPSPPSGGSWVPAPPSGGSWAAAPAPPSGGSWVPAPPSGGSWAPAPAPTSGGSWVQPSSAGHWGPASANVWVVNPVTNPTVTPAPPSGSNGPSSVIVIPGGYSSNHNNVPTQVIYKIQGMHIPGGILMPGLNDLHYCLHACASNITCEGFDFNFVDRTCWFHTVLTVCNMPEAKADCTNFKFTPCPTSTTSSTPGAVTTATNIRVCTAMMNIPGGMLQDAAINTQALCEAACQGNAMCMGIDFDTNGNTCWFHTAGTECSMMVASATTTHCRFVACPGILMAFPGMHALGGTLQPGIATVNDCIAMCQAQGAAVCVAVDFDSQTNTCWFHTAATCNIREAKPQCMHIVVAMCP